MSKPKQLIHEEHLRESICDLKERKEFRVLAEYLVGAISSGQLPPQLQAKAYNELGLAHLQLDEPLEAEKAFMSAVERDPKAVNPRFNLANLSLYAQEYTRAFGQFSEVLDIDSDHVGATYHAGLCLAMTDRPAEALPYFEASAKADHEAMGPHFWAGETFLALGKSEQALPFFLRAAEITPDHRESQRGVAICLFEQEDYEQCINQCDLLILSGQGAEFLGLQIKGDALIELGETEEAAHCHLALAHLDFDARDYLLMRSRKLENEHPNQAPRYIEIITQQIPEMDRDFIQAS